MAIRLYPDIVVATAINFSRKFALQNRDLNKFNKVRLDINRCLYLQEEYTHIVITNVFIGFENKKWTKKDYEEYISSFKKGFIYICPGIYEVDLIELLDIEKKVAFYQSDENYFEILESYLDSIPYHEFVYMLCDKLFTLSTYPMDVLKKLGLNLEEEYYTLELETLKR